MERHLLNFFICFIIHRSVIIAFNQCPKSVSIIKPHSNSIKIKIHQKNDCTSLNASANLANRYYSVRMSLNIINDDIFKHFTVFENIWVLSICQSFSIDLLVQLFGSLHQAHNRRRK